MFALAFESKGVFDSDMFSNVDRTWDVWHWKAFRTNPQGYSMDKRHIYTTSKPIGKARPYQRRNGKTVWISRPQDEGITVEKKRPAPSSFIGDTVEQYQPSTPRGSTADVKAKGMWKNGRWSLEFSRKLDTKYTDDTAFDINKVYTMGLAPFNLKTSVGREKVMQDIGVHGEPEKFVVTLLAHRYT